jgi:hypothetical protein
MKRNKPRVIWCVEKPTEMITWKNGIAPGLWYPSKRMAKDYGKPVKFVEVI